MFAESADSRHDWPSPLQHFTPEVVIVLGSGLGPVADAVTPCWRLCLAELAHGQNVSVPGHAGLVIGGHWAGHRVLVFQGRFHAYEGLDASTVCFPVRWSAQLGARLLILTNAAGGIRDDLKPGSLMLVQGWLSWFAHNRSRYPPPYFASAPNNSDPPAPQTTPHRLTEQLPLWTTIHPVKPSPAGLLLCRLARQLGVPLSGGVLAGVLGPNYETPAEIRALRALGADAVGMSTVLELAYAQALGLETIALSCITNRAAGLAANRLCHDEVLRQAAPLSLQLADLLYAFLQSWPTVQPP